MNTVKIIKKILYRYLVLMPKPWIYVEESNSLAKALNAKC